jgi:hypothetical protein
VRKASKNIILVPLFQIFPGDHQFSLSRLRIREKTTRKKRREKTTKKFAKRRGAFELPESIGA